MIDINATSSNSYALDILSDKSSFAQVSTDATSALSLVDTTFQLAGKILAGYVYDTSDKGHDTGLHEATSESTNKYPAYCVDMSTTIDRNKYYRKATDDQIEELFDISLVKRIRWIINHAFPVISDLHQLEQMTGAVNLTFQDVVNAAQGAIWTLTNPSTFTMGRDGTRNNANVILLYDYYMQGSNPGWELSDVISFGDGIQLSFDLSRMQQTVENSMYSYGPIQLTSNSFFTDGIDFPLSISESWLSFYDTNGQHISSVRTDTDFYIRGNKVPHFGSFSIGASSSTVYGADFHILMCTEGKKASQSCGILEYLSKYVSADADICLSKLAIRKIGDDDCYNPLQGAKFVLYTKSGTLLLSGVSDEIGILYFYNLLPGEYVLKEIIAPDGYTLPSEPINVTVECPFTGLTINNERVKCRIKIIKYDKYFPDKRLAGAEFNIINSAGQLVGSIVTDENGEGISDYLPKGYYKLIEVKAPYGYKLDKTPISVKLDPDCDCENGIKVIHICNVKEKGKIKIIKVDEKCKSKRLSDAVFIIKDRNNEVVDTLKTNKNGEAISKPLSFGEYKLIEIKAPYGYKKNTRPIAVSLRKTEKIIVVKNKKKHRDCDCECDKEYQCDSKVDD